MLKSLCTTALKQNKKRRIEMAKLIEGGYISYGISRTSLTLAVIYPDGRMVLKGSESREIRPGEGVSYPSFEELKNIFLSIFNDLGKRMFERLKKDIPGYDITIYAVYVNKDSYVEKRVELENEEDYLNILRSISSLEPEIEHISFEGKDYYLNLLRRCGGKIFT